MELANLMAAILDGACPNGGGDHQYYIETHCVGWNITAHKNNGQWQIGNATSEDC